MGVVFCLWCLPWRVQIRRWSAVVEYSAGNQDYTAESPSCHRPVLGPDLQTPLPRVSSHPPYTPDDRFHSDSGCSGQLEKQQQQHEQLFILKLKTVSG